MTKFMYETTLHTAKQTREMAITKFMLSLLGWIGFPLLGISWLANMDNIKSTIIFIVSLLMVMVRFYYWVETAKQNRKLKSLLIEEREIEMEERRIGIIIKKQSIK